MKDFEVNTGSVYDYGSPELDLEVSDEIFGRALSPRFAAQDQINEFNMLYSVTRPGSDLRKAGETFCDVLKRIGFAGVKKLSERFSARTISALNPEDVKALDDLTEKFNLFVDAGNLSLEQAKEMSEQAMAILNKYFRTRRR